MERGARKPGWGGVLCKFVFFPPVSVVSIDMRKKEKPDLNPKSHPFLHKIGRAHV